MQIKELEAVLGTALVERGTRELSLTREGRSVLVRANRILSEAMELEADARHARGLGELNIGMIPTVAPYLLPGTLAALRAADITRDLRLREAQTADLLDSLREGRLDAVVMADPATAPDLIVQPLFTDRFVLAGSPARLNALGTSPEVLRPVGLPADQLLLLDEGHCLADQALEVCALDRRQTRLDLGASSLSTLCGLVAQGFGLTFLPEIALGTETRGTPALALRRFDAPEPSRQISLVRRAGTAQADWCHELAYRIEQAATTLVAQAAKIAPPA